MLRPTRSTLLWLSTAILALFDLLTILGLKTLIRIGDFLSTYDWLPIGLTLAAKTLSIPNAVVEILTLPLVFILCFVTVVTFTKGTEYRTAELTNQAVSGATAYLFALYLIFSIPRGEFYSITTGRFSIAATFVYFILLFFIATIGVTYPLKIGRVIDLETTEEPLLERLGKLLGGAALFTGGLATLASMDGAIAIVTLLLSIYRLWGSYHPIRIAPEANLFRSLQLFTRDLNGFVILFSLVTGVVLATKFYSVATSFQPYQLLWGYSWQINPVINTILVVRLVVFGIVAIGMVWAFLRIAKYAPMNTVQLSLLVGSLWIVCGMFLVFRAVGRLQPDSVTITPSIIYPVALATAVVSLEVNRDRLTPRVWRMAAISICAIPAVAFFLNPYHVFQTLFLVWALFGYWGGPYFARLGRRFQTNYKPSDFS